MSVRVSVMIIENQDSEHNRAGHHSLDKVEICSCQYTQTLALCLLRVVVLPISGTASLVIGISSDTIFIKTVNDNNTVTPATLMGLLVSVNTFCEH